MPAGRQRLNEGQHGHLAPWCLRRLGTGKQLEQGPLRAEPCWKDLLGHFSTGGSDVKGAWGSPREGSTETLHSEAHTDETSKVDSLLSDDVFPWKRCAGHSSHLHMMSDLREVQAQVHSMDGHTSPSFRWS